MFNSGETGQNRTARGAVHNNCPVFLFSRFASLYLCYILRRSVVLRFFPFFGL